MSWLVHTGVILAAGGFASDDNPAPAPSLRPGLKETDVAPGFLGFIVTFALLAAVVLLLFSLTRKIRRINHSEGADHVVEADIRLDPEPMGTPPPTTSERRAQRKAERRAAAQRNESGPAAEGRPTESSAESESPADPTSPAGASAPNTPPTPEV